jgi:hypothetical protein
MAIVIHHAQFGNSQAATAPNGTIPAYTLKASSDRLYWLFLARGESRKAESRNLAPGNTLVSDACIAICRFALSETLTASALPVD